MPKNRQVVQIILDGWGINPSETGNAILLGKTPVFDNLMSHYPYAAIEASGLSVGLPWGEVGNSEVGHTNLGAGKVIYQNLPRINIAIEDKSFFENETLLETIEFAKKNNSNLHLIGLASNGGVHSHIEHLHALLQLMKEQKMKNVFVHAILDGRDTRPDVGVNFIETLEEVMKSNKIGQLASIIGRFYAMDRNDNWDRTKKAYDLMTGGVGDKTFKPVEKIKEFYAKKILDEMMEPIVVVDNKENPLGSIKEKDSIIFFNFRPDRARQLTKAFVLEKFDSFPREKIKNLFFTTMMEYESGLPTKVVFPPQLITEPFGKIIAQKGMKQLRIAETEKYAHVTYFFNGGEEAAFSNEDRKIIPSPDVKSYDQKPEMSAEEVTKEVVKRIESKKYDFILINFANPDMVGHTGDLKATIKAVEAVDECLGKVIEAVLKIGGIVVITADHGNAEVMIDPITGKPNKEHTTNPVPLIIVDEKRKLERSPEELEALKLEVCPIGLLADVAPTILELMGVKPSKEMTGRSLVNDLA